MPEPTTPPADAAVTVHEAAAVATVGSDPAGAPRTNGEAAASSLSSEVAADPLLDDAPLDAIVTTLIHTPEKRRSMIEETILKARCEDIARRIIRDGGHTSMAALAREIGCAPVTIKRLLSTDVYRRTFARVSDELLGTIDERIEDERLDILIRGDAMQRRAMTVLNECFAIVRDHASKVATLEATARPQLLRLGIEAAAEVRAIVESRSDRKDGTTNVSVTVNKVQANIISSAIKESGIDLSDVISGDFLVPPKDKKEVA